MFNFDVNGGLTNNWQDNPIKFPTGLITRSRAKKFKEKNAALIQNVLAKRASLNGDEEGWITSIQVTGSKECGELDGLKICLTSMRCCYSC